MADAPGADRGRGPDEGSFPDLASGLLTAEAEALAAVELTDRAIMARDRHSIVRMWNPAASALYGYEREEAEGRVSHDLLAARFPRALSEIERELELTGVWEGPLLHLTKAGEPLVVVSRWMLQRTPDGEPNAVLEFNRRAHSTELADLLAPVPAEDVERVYVHEIMRDGGGEIVDLRLRFVNAEVRAAQGEHPAIGMPSADWYPGFRKTKLFPLCCEVAETGTAREFRDVRLQPPWVTEPYVVDGRVVPFGDLVVVRARDVTVERRTLQHLDDAQARVRLALNVAPVSVMQTDLDLTVQWVSGSIGLSASNPEALMGRQLPVGMAPADEPRFRKAVQRALDTRENQRLDVDMVAPGSPPHLAVVIAPRLEDDQVAGFMIAAQDITEHRRLLDEVQHRERLLSTISNATPDQVWLADIEGRFTFVNEAVASLLRRPASEIVGRTPYDLIPYADAAESAALNQAVLAADKPLTLQFSLGGPDGRRTFSTRRFPVRDRYGMVVGIGGIATETTEQLRGEQETRTRAAAMQYAGIGLALVRARDHVIVEANDEYCALFGYEPQDLVGQHATVLNAPEAGEDQPGEAQAARLLKQFTEDGKTTLRVHNIKRDSTRFWTEVTLVPWNHPEHGPCFINAQRDITEQVENEDALADARARLAEHGL